MHWLRHAALVALSLWVGGLVVLGAVAAPTLFTVLEARDPVHGRELAGVLFGQILTGFQQLSWGLGMVLLGSLAIRAALGPRPRRFAIRVWTVTAMLAVSLAVVFYITPQIDDIRRSVGGPITALADGDARKATFGRLHGLSNALMLLTLLGGLGLLWTEAQDGEA